MQTLKKHMKTMALRGLNGIGLFNLTKNSTWRSGRLLILCYHGISLKDEHEWCPGLFLRPDVFRQRLELLRSREYNVLALQDGLTRLYKNDLPPRAVCLTFDDGFYNFYRFAYPILAEYGYPVTVYLTTFYTTYNKPIFLLACSYLLWRNKHAQLDPARLLWMTVPLSLFSEASRTDVLQQIADWADKKQLSAEGKNEFVQELAEYFGSGFEEVFHSRLTTLMKPDEVAELSRQGVDFQLHTHRHRTPVSESLFLREVTENRERIAHMTGRRPVHFCYPSGVYHEEFVPWLRSEEVVSATTCDNGVASIKSDPFVLPRFLDHSGITPIEYESWLCGFGKQFRRER
jgi:peptidoglycan/xylan/chitin deacetylase (PgdA/CDA1 family)